MYKTSKEWRETDGEQYICLRITQIELIATKIVACFVHPTII
jgi:hypothetical protein